MATQFAAAAGLPAPDGVYLSQGDDERVVAVADHLPPGLAGVSDW
jgi:hypothetical protein